MKKRAGIPIVLSEEDFKVLKALTETVSANGNKQEMTLSYEINRAKVMKSAKVPAGTIRLNSEVTVKDVDSNREMKVVIVLPSAADIKQSKISVISPMGAALIGLKLGDQITWKMPAGLRNLEVLEVVG